jgi:hypothetical protein
LNFRQSLRRKSRYKFSMLPANLQTFITDLNEPMGEFDRASDVEKGTSSSRRSYIPTPPHWSKDPPSVLIVLPVQFESFIR